MRSEQWNPERAPLPMRRYQAAHKVRSAAKTQLAPFSRRCRKVADQAMTPSHLERKNKGRNIQMTCLTWLHGVQLTQGFFVPSLVVSLISEASAVLTSPETEEL